MPTRLLVDTHVLLWIAAGDDRLGPIARGALERAEHLVYVSAVTAWEIAIKRALDKLDAPEELEELFDAYRLTPLAVTVEHAMAVEHLPRHHRDPFDRMLVAQARCEGLTIVSNDARLAAYDVPYLSATR